jgi:hypothetical protein
MSALQDHIRAINAKTQAWIDEDPDNRWAGMLTDDVDHWHEAGVYTPDRFDRMMTIETYIDIYKDYYGIKPRWVKFDELSTEEIEFMTSLIISTESSC